MNYTTKTLAHDMAAAHAASPFTGRDAAILWAYQQGRGVTLNMADQAYKQSGLKLGGSVPASRKEEALEWLASKYPTATGWDSTAVRAAVKHIMATYGVKEGAARDYCKAFSDELEVPHPVATTDSDEVIAWVVEHYDDHDDYESLKDALIAEFTARGRSRSNINEYTKGLRMHYAILTR